MTIRDRGVPAVKVDGKQEMTMEHFKNWVKTLDCNKDGKISKEELAEAVRSHGGWFPGLNGKRGVRAADANGNGFIDENETDKLADFAKKHLGIKIIAL